MSKGPLPGVDAAGGALDPAPGTAPPPDSSTKPTRVAFQNVGCKLNQCEVEALQDGFQRRGYELVPFGAGADVYVVNTCTVTGSGDADSRRAVRRAVRFNPDATVVATGCYAQRRPDALREAGAELVVGNDDKANLVDTVHRHLTVNHHLADSTPVATFDPSTRPKAARFLEIHGAPSLGRTRGTLKIQDGCDEHCTYCVIPSVRGVSVSRPLDECLEQARRMVTAGYREVVLTGVHTGSYGVDFGEDESLLSLLRALEEIDGLARIRLNSVEPGFVTDALIRHLADSSKLCRHFHIPLQSGDDQILRRMGRRYTARQYARVVESIADLVPDCAIGADVMVGFPGESREHFDNTFELIRRLPLTYLHVFSYSMRDGTAALRLGDRQTRATQRPRARQLIRLGEDKRLAFNQRFLGTRLRILIEECRSSGADASGLAVGRSDNYVKVLFNAATQDIAVNEFAEVRVDSARQDAVFGEWVPS